MEDGRRRGRRCMKGQHHGMNRTDAVLTAADCLRHQKQMGGNPSRGVCCRSAPTTPGRHGYLVVVNSNIQNLQNTESVT